MSMYKPLVIAAATLALGACATVPQPLQGQFNDVSTSGAQQGGAPGAKVRWGGEIIKTEPGPQQTCFFVLSEPLDTEAATYAKAMLEQLAWWASALRNARADAAYPGSY